MLPAALRTQIESTLSHKFDVSFKLRAKADPSLLPSGVPQIDFPRGTLTEIHGASSSGKTSTLLATLARATRLPECCALVDASDAFDPCNGKQAGIDLSQLLWVRCQKKAEYALKATDLLVQAGGFGIVALDLGGIPARDARRISLASWFRLRHTVEKTTTALVVLGDELLARSCSTLHIEMHRTGTRRVGALLRGIGTEAKVGPRVNLKTEADFQPVFRN